MDDLFELILLCCVLPSLLLGVTVGVALSAKVKSWRNLCACGITAACANGILHALLFRIFHVI